MRVTIFYRNGKTVSYLEDAILQDKEAGFICLADGKLSGGRNTGAWGDASKYRFDESNHIRLDWSLVDHFEVRDDGDAASEPGYKGYWPNAVTTDGEWLFTSNGAVSLDEAIEQFNIWEDTYFYKINEAWIDTPDGKRLELEKTWRVKDDAEN